MKKKMRFSDFKEKFEIGAFISVYLGYLIQLIIFRPYSDIVFWFFIGIFIFSMTFLFTVMFSYYIVIIHHIIYLYTFSDIFGVFDSNLAFRINTLFFLPFYIVILYPIINAITDIDSFLEKKFDSLRKR
jgi:hypothetical protein